MYPTTPTFKIVLQKPGFGFAAVHFLVLGAAGREPLHGHDFGVTVTIEGPLDADDMVADFTVVEPMVSSICASLDGHVLVPTLSSRMEIRKEETMISIHVGEEHLTFPSRDVALLPLASTSAEALAGYIAATIEGPLREAAPRVTAIEVALEEAAGATAVCRLA